MAKKKSKKINRDDAVTNFKNTKTGKARYRKLLDAVKANYGIDDDATAEYWFEAYYSSKLNKTYANKTLASKAINSIIDEQLLSANDFELKKAKQLAKETDMSDFDFRRLNNRKGVKVNKQGILDPTDLLPTSNASEVEVDSYYDFGPYVILNLRVTIANGSPIPTSVLATADILGKIK